MSKRVQRRGQVSNHASLWSVKGSLELIAEAIAGGRSIVIVEDEEDVDNLANWNVLAICGADRWRGELNEHFRGADIVLVPDKDEAGHQYIHVMGAALNGIAKSIRVVL